MKKKSLILLLTFTIIFNAFSQETPPGFFSYTLENGLEVYVQEDFTVPTMSIEYISKAGTGRQTEKTTGFFQLYSRLFWKNNVTKNSEYDKIGAGEFTAQTGYSQSRYSFIVPSQLFNEGMKLFSQSLKHSNFTDADIEYEYELLKNDVNAWASSVPGYINSSIDARIFSDSPWTKDSGVYPALFSSFTNEEVRQKLSRITNTWYVPDQSSLFISGPISAKSILNIVSEHFSDWQSSFVIGETSSSQNAKSSVSLLDIEKEHKLFVLTSNDFSKDYIQAVIQYTAPGLGANEKFSATSWTAAEIMQTKLLEAGMTNTNTSYVADAADSRIIIQTLFDAQSLGENTDISLMVPGFANIVKSTGQLITETDLDTARNRAQLFRNDAYTGADNFMSAIAANWAYGGVEYFFNWPTTVENVSLSDVKNSFSDPWIFVLVHTDLYEKNKERFKSFGYENISEINGPWYVKNIENSNNTIITPTTSIMEYSSFTQSLITEFSSSANIPVVTQSIPATPWISVLFNFGGGEILHGEHKRGTEEIAVKHLANAIENRLRDLFLKGTIKTVPSIENETEIYFSNINIVCLSDDLRAVLDVVSKTIKESTISIAAADELFISSAYNWRIKSGSLEYQLYAAAMETLYGGTKAEGLYDANKELLMQADYNDIKYATELLYDPNRISIVLTGNIPATIEDDIESYFGKTHFYPIERELRYTAINEQVPVFSPFEQIVRLRHTFLTDVPASLAGERPTKLIPTTDFSDPAQLYFEVPTFTDFEHALFIALLYETADRISDELLTYRAPPAESVSVLPGAGKYPVSTFRFSKVKSRETLKIVVQNIFDELQRDLSNENVELLTTIKSRYTRILSRELQTLSDRSYLINQGIITSNKPSLYLEKFEIVENANREDFASTFSKFLSNGEFFWLFSADTKR